MDQDASPTGPDGRSAAAPSRFQILALDGGGAKALFTAHVLAGLEEDLGVSIADEFDLIAGTSAGGIVALALGAGLPPREIADHFGGLVTSVFPGWRRRSPMRALRPAYRGDALREALTGVLGERVLGDSLKRLIIPSYDVQVGSVHVFKTPHHPRLRRDWRVQMVDVAMATTSAPTYFRAARVDDHRLVDGGIWANNPSVIAIGEAVSMLGVPLEAIRVLNVGTLDQVAEHSKRLDRGGLVAWMRPAAPLLLTASSRGAQGTAEHLVGKGDYQRFDARVPGGMYSLDKIDASDLAGIANSVSRFLSPTYTERFAGHHAPIFQPLAGPRAGAHETPSTQQGEPT